MLNYYQKLKVSTPKAFTICDVTEDVGLLVRESGVLEGMITITSFHTTCALSVNENEERLFDDIRNFFLMRINGTRHHYFMWSAHHSSISK